MRTSPSCWRSTEVYCGLFDSFDWFNDLETLPERPGVLPPAQKHILRFRYDGDDLTTAMSGDELPLTLADRRTSSGSD